MQTEDRYNKIIYRLNQLRKKEKLLSLLKGILILTAFIAGSVLLLSVLEFLIRFSSVVRITIVLLFTAGGLFVVIKYIFLSFFSLFFRLDYPDDVFLALETGKIFSQIKDRLADAVQVYLESKKNRYGTSAELAEKALLSISEQTADLDFREAAATETCKKWMRFALISFFCGLILFAVFPAELGDGLNRLTHPFTEYSKPSPFTLKIYPGNVEIIQGEDVHISVESTGSSPEYVFLYYRFKGETEFSRKKLIYPFSIEFSSVRRSFEYFAGRGQVETSHYNVKTVIRPLVRKLQIKLFSPSYSRLPVKVLAANRGDINGLKGARAELSLQANKPLFKGEIRFEKGNNRQLHTVYDKAFGRFSIIRNDSYSVMISDSAGRMNNNPITYSIHIEPDYPPAVNILSPKRRIDIDERMVLDLSIEAHDDFGVSDLRICYRIIHQSVETDSSEKKLICFDLPIEKNEPVELSINYKWVLEGLDFFPEDLIYYYAEVFDNDRVSGPKSTKTSVYSARFPSISEIYREVASMQEGQIETLEDIYKKSGEMQDEFQDISEEFKSEGKLEWEEKKNIESMTESQKKLNDKIQDLQKGMDDIIEKMDKNELISPETLKKYQELQQLYDEIDSPEMKEAMQKLREAMENIDPEVLKRNIEDFKLAEENFRKSIERTISLLKRIQIEQKSEALVKRLQKMTSDQEQINEQLRNQKKDLSGQIRKEEMIKKGSESVRKDMDELHNKMSEIAGMPCDQMKSVMDSMDNEKVAENAQHTVRMMKSGNKSDAVRSGEKVEKSLQKLTDMMQDVSENIKSKQKNRIARALQRASLDLLRISQLQEELIRKRMDGKITGSSAAVEQMGLKSGLQQTVDSLVCLSQKTFFITPEMGKALGKANANMDAALKQMDAKKVNSVSYSQKKAVGSLNQCVMEIQDAMDKLQGGGSGMGMEQFLMQMEKMAGEQSSINKQTMELLGRGKLSLAEQAAMQRLAEQQQRVRKSIEKLLNELGSIEDIFGRLDRTVEDMKEVVRSLRNHNVGRETISRQQRILSRLLDLQQSVRNKDFSRKRRAVAGENVIRVSPESLHLTRSEINKMIHRDILLLRKEGYTQKYQKLIRSYFESLLKERNISGSEKSEKK